VHDPPDIAGRDKCARLSRATRAATLMTYGENASGRARCIPHYFRIRDGG
jgi:hypothetical protein